MNHRTPPYPAGDYCLLCRSERKDSSFLESGVKTASKLALSMAPKGNSVLHLPLWVCPDCRRTVEKDERHGGLEQPAVSARGAASWDGLPAAPPPPPGQHVSPVSELGGPQGRFRHFMSGRRISLAIQFVEKLDGFVCAQFLTIPCAGNLPERLFPDAVLRSGSPPHSAPSLFMPQLNEAFLRMSTSLAQTAS